MTRRFQAIQAQYWEKARHKGLSADELLVELFLITWRDCRASGVLIAATSTIAYYTGIEAGSVTVALRSLRERGRIETYPGDWVWVVGKWEHESTKTEQVQKSVIDDLQSAPATLMNTWLARYGDTLKDTLKVSLSQRLNSTLPPKGKGKEEQKEKQKGKEKDSGDSPPGVADQNLFGEKPKSKKKPYRPIRLRAARTPNSRTVRHWHAEYYKIHGEEYSGDVKVMVGQIAQLLRQGHNWLHVCASMCAFLDAANDKYTNYHSFNTFIRHYSKWSEIGKQKKYAVEVAEEGVIPGAEIT